MRRRTLVAGAATAAVVASGATAAVVGFSGTPQAAQPSQERPETAEVVKTTLRDTVTIEGTLGYGDPVPVNGPQGTVTWMAATGSTVKRGKPLFKVDEKPFVVLYGKLPLYRELAVDVEGEDVEQLEKNLQALGYDGFTVDEYFTDGTADAVAEWQDDLGLDDTGSVKPGDLLIVPSAVRVDEHTARVGSAAGQGEVLSYTGVARRVVTELEVADQALAKKGRKVTVTVPGGKDVTGTITDVDTVASSADDSSDTPEGEGDGSASDDAVIEVTVSLPSNAKLGGLDGGPVDVTFTSGTRKNVLAVPVAALLGLSEGGYGVEVVDGSSTRVVAVDTGLFADGMVEVSGEGLEEGTTVGVAS